MICPVASDEDVNDGRGAAPAGPRFTYPLMLDVSDRLVVIVGGGAVAVRKARGLLQAGANRVRCVAPEIDPQLPASVERVSARYEPRHLEGAELVFAATDSADVNAAVVRDARQRGALVSRADAEEDAPGDFTSPASFRDGPACVAVSAGGSPAVAALIRDGLRDRWDSRWRDLAEAAAALRPVLLRSPLDADSRRAALRDLASEEAMAVLERGSVSDLFDWLCARYPQLNPVTPDS
jgi:precorrin-2 dehydrogenase/sirohydrochlorin ferrochelatase